MTTAFIKFNRLCVAVQHNDQENFDKFMKEIWDSIKAGDTPPVVNYTPGRNRERCYSYVHCLAIQTIQPGFPEEGFEIVKYNTKGGRIESFELAAE